MDAITWTVEQLGNYDQRIRLIEMLYTTADPGTFTNLEQLTLSELESLAGIMDPGDVA
jgi:hypothetical protein